MGQSCSGSSVNKERNEFLFSQKEVIILVDNEEYSITIEDENLTCGWLLSEVIRRHGKSKEIVSLTSESQTEALDYFLTCFHCRLKSLPNGEVLLPVFKEPVNEILTISDFDLLKKIGKGGYSYVYQGRKKDTGNIYAIKVINKNYIFQKGKTQQVLSEKQILQKLHHEFVTKLHWSFETEENYYLVLDFCAGGELFHHLQKKGPLVEEEAKFYFAEILVALEHLHSLNIIYRDLKPENVLVDLNGHIKLADFGLSKEVDLKRGRRLSFCGSPEYMSPEMLKREGHSFCLDFYCLGALLHEMLTGLPPHYSKDKTTMFNKIISEQVHLPKFLSKEAQSIVQELLVKDPFMRLGHKCGAADIKKHSWLKGVNWSEVALRKLKPSFVPSLKNSHFDTECTKNPVDLYDSPLKQENKLQELYLQKKVFSCDFNDGSTNVSRACSRNSLDYAALKENYIYKLNQKAENYRYSKMGLSKKKKEFIPHFRRKKKQLNKK